MFCSWCGAECPASAKFFGHCGQQINEATQNTTKKDDEGGASGGTFVTLTFKQFKSKKVGIEAGLRSKQQWKQTS